MTALLSSIQKTLLLGTSRAANLVFDDMPDTLQEELFAADKTAVSAADLWECIAAYDLWKRAGAQALPVERSDTTIAADDIWRPCTAQAETKLFLLLQGSHPELRVEWLTLAQQFHVHLPYKYLPAILDLGAAQPDFRILIGAVLGERGRWLAKQNPVWNWVSQSETTSTELWDIGTLEQRVNVLQQVRAQDAEMGRKMLADVWRSEPPEHRMKLIPCLKVGLGAADQAFLELALDDKRKEVRNTAQAMLLAIPESFLVLRMRTRLDSLLALPHAENGEPELLVNLPLERDKAMQRDGIGNSLHQAIGEKAGWLLDMIAAVSPLHWTEKWQFSAAKLLQLAEKSEYQHVLMAAWVTALQNQTAAVQDVLADGLQDWCEQITKICLQAGSQYSANFRHEVFKIWVNLPQVVCDDFLQELLDDSPLLWTSTQLPLMELLNMVAAQRPHWPANLSVSMIARLRNGLVTLTKDYWFIKQMLTTFAIALDPTQLAEYEREWPMLDPVWDKWQTTIDDFLALLRFRSEMLQSFQEQA